MTALLKSYLVGLLVMFAAVLGVFFFALSGGRWGLPATVDPLALGVAIGATHLLAAIYGLGLGARKQAGRRTCALLGLLLGLIGALVASMLGDARPDRRIGRAARPQRG